MATRSWLLSAFDPFLGRQTNHSITVLERILAINHDPHLDLHGVIIPTEYDRCDQVLLAEIHRLRSLGIQLHGVLSIGEGKEEFKIETQANNLNHAPQSADNAGTVRTQQKIFSDREAQIPIAFPVEKFQIQASVNPGFFVCNHLCAKMAVAREKDPALPLFGFIHVPRSDLTRQYPTEFCTTTILAGLRNL